MEHSTTIQRCAKYGDPGSTKFAIYAPYAPHVSYSGPDGNVPTAGNGTFHNYGGEAKYAKGCFTEFSNAVTADCATLIAYGGSNGGEPRQIKFADDSLGANAAVELHNGGMLALSYHTGVLTIKSLAAYDSGAIQIQLGKTTSGLAVSDELNPYSDAIVDFDFYSKRKPRRGKSYTILS
ncbi:MAG: hypothetical protein CMJ78_03995 [Planctomycetaceae bacterium]|nr:hypothetical protein [Planctomycetaceae bacterium]